MIWLWLAVPVVLIYCGLALYALPATLSLPAGIRPPLEPLTIAQAAEQLKASGKAGHDLVEAARALVAERMAYCRRNSFDSSPRAFLRGYGYCVQQAVALADLLNYVGLKASVVHAFRNRFPDGSVESHAWVQVCIDGEITDLDSRYFDVDQVKIAFIPLTRVMGFSPAFDALTRWGAAAVNAYRFYRTGKDD